MELRQLEDLKKNIRPERKEFIRLVREQDIELDDLLISTVDEFNESVNRYSRNNRINDQDELSKHVPVVLGAFTISFVSLMKQFNKRSAEIRANAVFKMVSEDYPTLVTQPWMNRVEKYPTDVANRLMVRKFPVGNVKVGEAIKTIEKSSINVVRSIITVGINDGRSAERIASDIQMYIRPLPEGKSIPPFQWVRDRLGVTRATPLRTVRGGTLNANAYRIARTEINNTYTKTSLELNKNAKWIRGYRWVLSPSHPKTDECDSLANHRGLYDYMDIPERPHPHCMCDVHEVLVPPSELGLR